MKKLMIVSDALAGRGGEEIVIREAVTGLGKHFDITLVLLMTEAGMQTPWFDEIQTLAHQVVVVRNEKGRLNRILQVSKAVLSHRQDLIIAFTPRIVLTLMTINKIFRRSSKILSWLQFSPKSRYSPKEIEFLKHANGNLVLNHGMAAELEEFGVPEVLNHAVGNPVKRQSRVIKKSEPDIGTRFIYIARIQFRGDKNIKELIEALALVSGNWHLDVYGGDDTDGQIELQQASDLTKELGIDQRIEWHGYQKDPWAKISVADSLILTSTSEGFGLVLAEAASFGIPVISSDCPIGPREIVNQQNGFLYPMGDVHKLADYLQKFVDSQYHFDAVAVKHSIEPLYEDQYFLRMTKILDSITQPHDHKSP